MPTSGQRRSTGARRTRRLTLVVALASLVAIVVSSGASGSQYLRIGIFDDAQVFATNPRSIMPLIRSTNARVLRVTLWWSGTPQAVAKRRPEDGSDPNDSAYNWEAYDERVQVASELGMDIVLTILGTPTWANGGKKWNVAPTDEDDLEAFARAAATRYSGTFVRGDGVKLPRVRSWMAWNEPNNPVFLTPQFKSSGSTWVFQSPRDYARICNAVVRGVKDVSSSAKVGCGATAPRGNNNPNSSRPSVSPLPFLRGMRAAGATGFDAYAHHPYYGRANETPTSKPPPGPSGQPPTAITLGNIGLLITELTRLYGNKRVWITEYGFQTNPPDTLLGVSWARQAQYLAQSVEIVRRHPRIDMFIWFLLIDEARLEGWQSGLFTSDGRRKPAMATFQRIARAP